MRVALLLLQSQTAFEALHISLGKKSLPLRNNTAGTENDLSFRIMPRPDAFPQKMQGDFASVTELSLYASFRSMNCAKLTRLRNFWGLKSVCQLSVVICDGYSINEVAVGESSLMSRFHILLLD